MKFIDAILFIEFADFLSAGFKEDTIKKNNYRNGEYWMMIDNPSDKRKPLVQYDTLREKDKEKLVAKFGDPYEFMAKVPIKRCIVTDFEAKKFFIAHEITPGECLPPEHVETYCNASNWLLFLNGCTKAFVKKEFGLDLVKFYEKVGQIIKTDNIGLPASYKHLRKAMKKHADKDYKAIVDWRFNNTNGLKLKDELSKSTLEKLISTPHVDDALVARSYNNWAKNNGYKTIGQGTVGNFKREHYAMLKNAKEGSKAWFDTYGKVIKRRRASCPNACWEHDDNDLDLYFTKNKVNKKGNMQLFYYGRFVVAVVMDTYNDYIVGWAMAETYTKDLIRLAYLDAVYHVHELTGGWYLPHQIRSDRFGLDPKLSNDLAQFYQRIATYTPAKAKSARGKYIEQSFGKKMAPGA